MILIFTPRVLAQTNSEANQLPKTINENVSNNFSQDVTKIAAILDEEKRRQNITSVRVAYGMGITPMDSAEYYVNFAAEAIAYQKIQDYTPSSNSASSIQNSLNNLISNLTILQGKVLKAKSETQTVLNYYEK